MYLPLHTSLACTKLEFCFFICDLFTFNDSFPLSGNFWPFAMPNSSRCQGRRVPKYLDIC